MSNEEKKGQLLIYRTVDGNSEIEVDLHNDSVWLTQKQIADLFQVGVDTINVHLKNIYSSGELREEATIEKNSIVQKEGSRSVKREIYFYNLDAILSIGYRVNTRQGTHFRIWASQQLKQLLVKGFVLDDEKLKGTKSSYFDELYDRVRSIRTSEKNLYTKVKDIFALTSFDYEPSSEIAIKFFASVQNMFHYAIHGHTASELIKERADAYKDNMGLYTWSGSEITLKDALVAKNYLDDLELKRLELLSEQFLSFAELQSIERRPMYMATWITKLIDFLKLNDKPILTDAGKVTAEVGKQIALKEFNRFNDQLKQETKGLKKYLEDSASDTDYEDVKKTKPNFGNVLGAVARAGKPDKGMNDNPPESEK